MNFNTFIIYIISELKEKYKPCKKLTVNQEQIPSSKPSIISTESSLILKLDCFIASLTTSNNLSAAAGSNNRKPAVALNIKGVLCLYSCGITVLATSKRYVIDSAP